MANSNAHYKHFTYIQRQRIHELLDQGYTHQAIGKDVGMSRAAVTKEIQRGLVDGAYDPDYSESLARKSKSKHRVPAKLESDPVLASKLAALILDWKLSPEEAITKIKKLPEYTNLVLSKQTLYRSIYAGHLPGVTFKSLPSSSSTIFGENSNLITLPKWVLEKLDAKAGDIIEYDTSENGDIIIRKAQVSKSK